MDVVTRQEAPSSDRDRLRIRDAMARLLDGQPLRSDGKLTVKSLAEEAGVKRWLLTHKHTDLQDEFRARVDARDSLPPAQQALVDENTELRARNAELSEQLAAARDEAHQLARIVQTLTLENEQLRSAKDAKVRTLRPGR